MIEPKPDPQIERERVLMARPRTAEHDKPATWLNPDPVTMAKCQAHVAGCTNLVPVYPRGMEALESFSRILAARGEHPLDLNACFPCHTCLPKRLDAWAERCAQRRTATTEAIRYVRSCALDDVNAAFDLAVTRKGAPARASDTVVKLSERLGWLGKVHGDGYVTEFVNAMRERARNGGRKPRREEL